MSALGLKPSEVWALILSCHPTFVCMCQAKNMLHGAGVGLPAGDGHCVAVLQSLREQEECAGGQNVANQAQLPRYAPTTLCMLSCFPEEYRHMLCCNDPSQGTPLPPTSPCSLPPCSLPSISCLLCLPACPIILLLPLAACICVAESCSGQPG